jgi:RNA polymerase sigma-70 factor (ECF subfamily)
MIEGTEELAALLLGIREHERVALVLRHVAGLSYAEIGEALGCPVGTAKARVHRGLASLERVMGTPMTRDFALTTQDLAEEESA